MHPHLFQFGHFILPTYGALVALGLIVSLLVCHRAARLLALNTDKIWNLSLLAIGVTIVGAKFLLVAVNWHQYGMLSLAVSLAGAPGALLGGAILAIAACWLYAWRARLPLRRSADAMAPALAVGNSIAAIGRLEAGYAYGAPTLKPWAVIYTSRFVAPGTPTGVPLHPTQIYTSLMEFALFVLLLWLIHRPHADGEIMGAWLFLSGVGGFFLTFLRGDAGGSLFAGFLTEAQWIAIAMVLLGGFLWLRREPPQSPQQPLLQPRKDGEEHASQRLSHAR